MHTAESQSDQQPIANDTQVQKNTKQRPAIFRALGKKQPPDELTVGGQIYQLVKVLKHDSWAATALYENSDEQIICKFQRQQSVLFLPMKWFGCLLAGHENSLYERLDGLGNIPRNLGRVYVDGKEWRNVVAHHYVPGHPLGETEQVSDEFFPTLESFLKEMHSRGVAYVDLHKRENILVGDDGQPYLIDFQISYAHPRWWPMSMLFGWLLHMLQSSDLYHLRKNFARCRPDLCGHTWREMGPYRPWYIRLHRCVGVPFRTLRRRLLVLLGIRSGLGLAHSEQFTEEGLRTNEEPKKAA